MKKKKKEKGEKDGFGPDAPKRNTEVDDQTEKMKASKADTTLVADDSLAGTPTMIFPGRRAIHPSLAVLIGPFAEGCNLAVSIRARTSRIKLSSMAVLCGDLCTYTSFQADWQQREDISYLQGFTNKLTYSFSASATLSPVKPYLAISNLGSFSN